MQAHFSNIQTQLLAELEKAHSLIFVATGWFTSENLMYKLIQKQQQGISVKIIVSSKDNSINNDIYSLAEEFINCGGIFLKVDGRGTSQYDMMHNKFCVIDFTTLITGSYNWTNNAEHSDENIVIIEDESLAEKYAENFLLLSARGKHLLETEIYAIPYFTASKKIVDADTSFRLFWEFEGAANVSIEGHPDLENITFSAAGQSQPLKIETDTYFTLIGYSYSGAELGRTFYKVNFLDKPEFTYDVEVVHNNKILPKEIFTSAHDSNKFIIPTGCAVQIKWESKHTDNVCLLVGTQSFVLEERGIKWFYPNSTAFWVFKASNIKHELEKSFFIQVVPIPVLKNPTVPFPDKLYSDILIKFNPLSLLNYSNSSSLDTLKHTSLLSHTTLSNNLLSTSQQSLSDLNQLIQSYISPKKDEK